jgi:hypothetical protein
VPGQTYPFALASGEFKSVGPIAFIPQAIGVDNPTPFFVHFPDASFGAWVRPFIGGAIVPAPARGRVIAVSAKDVPPNSASSPATPLIASCLAFEDSQPYSSGYALGGLTRATAFPVQTLPPGTYDFNVPPQSSFRGILAYASVTGGTGTLNVHVFLRDDTLPGFNANDIGGDLGNTGNLLIGQAGYVMAYPGVATVAPGTNPFVIGYTPAIRAIITNNSVTFGVDYDLLP